MKKLSFLLLMLLTFSCKTETKETPQNEPAETVAKEDAKTYSFPKGVASIFDAHGSFAKWKEMNTLSYKLMKEKNPETHLVDLKSRKTLISDSTKTIGFDGKQVWVAKDSQFPAEKARMYHNLYFYFYAMPFVLGDPGIKYEKVPNLEFEGVSYPGHKISFGSNVGDSPDDYYFIYANPENGTMEWLGYTFTYGADGPNNDISFIRYEAWEDLNGIKLPTTLQWYVTENNVPVKPRENKTTFKGMMLSEKSMNSSKFEMPEGATIGEK